LNGEPVAAAAGSLTPLPVVPVAPLAALEPLEPLDALVPLEPLAADVPLEVLLAVVVVVAPLVPVEDELALEPHPPATRAITPAMLANTSIPRFRPCKDTAAPSP
jgi:hypothetical protein